MSIEKEIAERGYCTFNTRVLVLDEKTIPVDIENKTGYRMEIEVHTFQTGRISVILRPPGSESHA